MQALASSVGKKFVVVAVLCICLSFAISANAQFPITNDPPFYGPFNGVFLPDGEGLKKNLAKDDSVLRADSPWTLYCWVKSSDAPNGMMLIAGVGNTDEEYPRYLAIDANKAVLWVGKDNILAGAANVVPGSWHMLAATFDGKEFRLYSDGVSIANGTLTLGTVGPVLQMAPDALPAPGTQHFGGKIASLTLLRRALTADELKQLHAQPPDLAAVNFEEGSKPWYVQTRGQAGYRAPQDAAQMPRSKAPFTKPFAKPLPPSQPALVEDGDNAWTLANGWTLIPAPKLSADVAQISRPGFNTQDWWAATIPGTVLTTMIDRGVYPDSDYDLNNLAIPESLNKQDYWYRTEFKAPMTGAERHLTLDFEGINYKAAVWLNGQSLGTITGAFIRGVFDVTGILKPGQMNVLAVRVSPPPHPGIPQEQSIKGGPGENGGIMCLDGPTFVATEGWDWIPAIRDRNTGIWQPVVLKASGGVKIGDPQIVTSLPLPNISLADVEITVPLENATSVPIKGTLTASFDQTKVSKEITLAPGRNSITLTPSEFSELSVQNPRLWWPNGYGKQELYTAKLAFAENGSESDAKQVRFGMREITYELGLIDSTGHIRRLEYSPTKARAAHQHVVDVTHEGMRELPPADPPPPDFPPEWREWWKSWAASLVPGAESSPAIHMLDDQKMGHYLVVKVNGVRIACRGGNWGMDDSRKRVSRAKLEPYFRLHHDANVNIIRNWVGQNTEETFYDLADEYGLLIWNDFWATTENYNIEPQDPVLFLDNARDTILRFRNHPSILMWCGRNEGVPQPIINEGLIKLIDTLDGTRYYSPSSNQVNLQNSGPYKFTDPTLYYTALNRGFSVETGTPSFSTLEAFRAWIAPANQWPISDAWAYHDWHWSGNGDVAPFMAEIQAAFGAATSLEDFERKAQMFNYTEHRAIFEGMNAHLFAPNSGRMLWMTQPAWPSNNWQILSSDYDTHGSYYGVKKACEPLHVQLDLSNYNVTVVNTTGAAAADLTITASVYSLDNKSQLHREEHHDAPANTEVDAFMLDLGPLLGDGVVLVKLELHNASGQLISDNFYWLGAKTSSLRALNKLPAANLSATATSTRAGDEVRVHVRLQNQGTAAALSNKLTLLNSRDGSRILPAYYSDNYVSLLPGETRDIDIQYPAAAVQDAPQVSLRGWNFGSRTVAITPMK
jgi:hypothetical protein